MLARHYKADDVRINDMIYSIVKVLRTKCVLDEISRIDVTVLLIRVMHFYCYKLEPKLVSETPALWEQYMDNMKSFSIESESFYALMLLVNLVNILVDLVSGWDAVDEDGNRMKRHKDMHLEALLRCVV